MGTTRIAIVAVASLAFAGCGGRQATRAGAEVNTGLSSLGDQGPQLPEPRPTYDRAQLDKLAAEAVNLQEVLAQMPAGGSEPADTAPAGLSQAEPPPAEQPSEAAASPEAPVTNQLPPKPLAVRVEETALSLVDLLRQQAATEGSARAYLGLAGMEFLHPGALQRMITPASTEGTTIPEEEMRTIEQLQKYFAAITGSDDKRTLGQRMADHLEVLTASCPFTARTVQLCSEVTGYGQYQPLGVDRFLNGRPIRAVVYAEVEHFRHRPVNDADRTAARLGGRELADTWAVELSQELQLYHRADGVLVWSRPEQAVVETSRNKRRDFYLVHTVSLPSTLTLGGYTLKVILRDRVGGGRVEVNVPFEIVAEASLAAETRNP